MSARVTVRIPAALRGYAGDNSEIRLNAVDVRSALSALGEQYPGLLPRILEPDGQVRQFVNLFVGDTHIASLDGMDTVLSDNVTITILPSVAGG